VNAIVPAIWAGLNDVTGRDTRLGALTATTMPPTISEAVFSTIARSQVASRPSLPPAPSPPMHPPLESSPLVASSDHVPIDPQQPAKHGIVEIILRISAISSVVLFIKARLPSVLSHMIMSSAEKWAKGLATKGGLWLAKGLGWKKPALQEKPEAALSEVVAMVLKAIDTKVFGHESYATTGATDTSDCNLYREQHGARTNHIHFPHNIPHHASAPDGLRRLIDY